MKKLFRRWVALFIMFAITVTGIWIPNVNAATSTQLKVHYIDVGESDSTLIQYGKKFMMIDAGDIDDQKTIMNYLKKQKVKKLEYLILTHPHADHIGTAADIINKYDVDKIIMPSKVHTTKTFENVLRAIQKKNKKITKPVVGTKYKFGDASFTILAPNSHSYGDNLNNYSISLKLTHNKNSFLFIGDCETEAIDDILSKSRKKLAADVYMCGHHGSDTSTTKELLKAVNPKYAIISVGSNNYGHPGKNTLSLLKKNKIKTYRTDESGTVVITSNGKKLSIKGKAFDFSKVNSSGATKPSSKPSSSSSSKPTSTSTTSNSYVYITETGTKYHQANCRYLKNSKYKISLKDAKKKGYSPCSSCN